MAYSDSMFLFEVLAEKLTSFSNCKSFVLRGQFVDVFSFELRDLNDIIVSVPRKKKTKYKTVRVIKLPPEQHEKPKLQCVQSIMLANTAEKLKADMKIFPIELSLWSFQDPDNKLGSTEIFWSRKYIDYLNKLDRKKTSRPVAESGEYNVFDEVTSKRIAIISLKIKLKHVKNIIERPITSILGNSIKKDMNISLKNESELVSNIGSNQKHTGKFDFGLVKDKFASDERKKDKRFNPNKNKNRKSVKSTASLSEENKEPVRIEEIKSNEEQTLLNRISTSLVNIQKVEPEYKNVNNLVLVKSKSFTSTKYVNNLNPLNYIFGDESRQFGNKVFYVGYLTVQNDTSKSQRASHTRGSSSSPAASEILSSETNQSKRYKIQICDGECPAKKTTDSKSYLSVDLPADAENLISVKKCDAVDCNARKHREPPPKQDERILLRLSQPQFTEKVEEVVGGVDAKLKFGTDPCYCSCECRFGFTKKTTYCNVCGGYEVIGEEIVEKDGQLPFPCPIFHKLVDKNKAKTVSTSGSEASKRTLKTSSRTDKSVEPEKLTKKGKQFKKDDRFKFNYGYEGIPPQIGHSQCHMPCTGTLGAVPKNMGWLWTAENVPGLKFRPLWRPGATNKHVVRLLRMAKNPGEILTKKRRRDQKPKKSLIRPLLIVHKKDGEYTVTMETMRKFNKPRAINQYPYEDKPLVTYTIGRTEEENFDRQKKKEREQRRLERMQRNFIQSAFRDMCHEICLKTYQQALGILPTTESPDCTCFPAHPDASQANLDVSCSCSEDQSLISSDTDSDEWIVEFTPPIAKFDPKIKSKKVFKVDNSSQYNYLDFRIKLVDRYGNPVPRYFKGQDGKQHCSDLGGFWSPDHKWLEINVDGYVGPDGRWAPNTFFGPDGELVESEIGKFQAANGKWYVVGIDGYVDAHNKWRAYARPRQALQTRKKRSMKDKGAGGDKKGKLISSKPSEGTFSCFGDVSPKLLSEMGILGHGVDKKTLLSALKDLIARGEDVKIPQPKLVPRSPLSKKSKKTQIRTPNAYDCRFAKCQHAAPSPKGVVAVNPEGDKIYFRLKDPRNLRPKQRLADLSEQGISLSSFHVPCFNSFINSEIIKRQQQERLLAHKDTYTQAAHWGNTQV